jgi:putative ABC transport system permease protein
MTIWRLALKEILHRKLSFALALLSVALAVGCLVGAVTLLGVHDVRTQQVLNEERAKTEDLLNRKQAETKQHMAELEDNIRKAMLNLGFNIVILSDQQKLEDWYANDSTSHYLPEEYAVTVAKADAFTVQHLLPCLQERVKWPEQKRTIILVGTPGEISGGTKKPIQSRVPADKIVLGNELHESLGLNVGDKLTLMGREFTVQQWYPMRGTKDDMTAWIDLKVAQELLDKKGKLSAILALECHCAFADVAKVREEISKVLPGVQVIERGSEALARAEARAKTATAAEESLKLEEAHAQQSLELVKLQRVQLRSEWASLASILVPVVVLGCAAWIAILTLNNVRQRRSEVGILRALGVRSQQILLLFLSKAVLMGLLGGIIGCVAGYFVGRALGIGMEKVDPDTIADVAVLRPAYAVLAIAAAPLLAAAASWLPAMSAARQDPALMLYEE